MGEEHAGLRVEPATADHLRALIAGPEAFRERYGVEVLAGYLEFDGVLEHALRQIVEDGADPAWWTHLFYDDGASALIGLGGFKGDPVDGEAELGYGIAPAYRGRGWATAVAAELVEELRRRGVTTAIAHTLAEVNASNRLLQNLGFTHTGDVLDDDAPGGVVWRWERSTA